MAAPGGAAGRAGEEDAAAAAAAAVVAGVAAGPVGRLIVRVAKLRHRRHAAPVVRRVVPHPRRPCTNAYGAYKQALFHIVPLSQNK